MLIDILQDRIDRYLCDKYAVKKRIRLEQLQLSLQAEVEEIHSIRVRNNHMAIFSRECEVILLDLEYGHVVGSMQSN